MNPVQEIKTTWQSIPAELKSFLKRAVFIFIVWKMLYHLFLFNGRIIDKPLTDFSAKTTVWVMQMFYPTSQFIIKEKALHDPELLKDLIYFDFIYKDAHTIVGIADTCNALELYVLYLGFIIAFPGTWIRKLFFSIIGIIAIFISNIIRLSALSVMNMTKMNAIDLAHHYIFKLIVYSLIFVLWMAYTGKRKDEKSN